MTKDVRTCQPSDTLRDAARILWERDCGVVPVLAGHGSSRVVGLLTDRDICMAAYTQGRSLGELSVESAMSHAPVTCGPSNTLKEAAERMRQAEVRRLPVVDESRQLLGLISLADLAREAARQEKPAARAAALAVAGETLAAVTRSRTA